MQCGCDHQAHALALKHGIFPYNCLWSVVLAITTGGTGQRQSAACRSPVVSTLSRWGLTDHSKLYTLRLYQPDHTHSIPNPYWLGSTSTRLLCPYHWWSPCRVWQGFPSVRWRRLAHSNFGPFVVTCWMCCHLCKAGTPCDVGQKSTVCHDDLFKIYVYSRIPELTLFSRRGVGVVKHTTK